MVEKNETKSIFESKTLWANVIVMVITALTAIQGDLSEYVNPESVVFVLGVLNVFLRFITTQPVTLTGNPK